MTKTIILVQGPDDGRQENVPADKKEFKVMHPRPLEPGKILLSMRAGIYKQTAEYDSKNREMFLWWGWQDQ